ncbi:MAG: hypothetical protein Q8K90_08395 [Brevundimonas sp.]|nr:hypothetical protein [Brevundimonas sp.]
MCLFGLAAVASAGPAAACADVVGRPPPPIRTLEVQDAAYLRQGAVVALASIVERGDDEWRFRIDGETTGDFPDEVILEDGIIIDCRAELMPIVPESGALGDRVLLVRSDANNIQYAVLLETQRGRRLWTRVSRSAEIKQ